jgi:hypothetical protein
MSLLTDSQQGDLRVALLDELVGANQVAFNAETLVRRVKRARVIDYPFTLQEAEHELAQLVGLGLAAVVPDAVTRQPHYQATPKGIIARG